MSSRVLATLFILISFLLRLPGDTPPAPANPSLWNNPDKPIPERVQALISQLTMKEKISLLYWIAPAIDRLGIKAYNHGDEGLHGLVRPGNATVFPEAIGLAATFDPDGIHDMSSAIGDEARAKWNQNNFNSFGISNDPLVLWSPVVNMVRDPRWGRTQETYGEDPWLTACLGTAFVRGLQGDDPTYYKVISTPKHFAGNNDEDGRFGKNIVCDERYLQEFEFAGFRACITQGHAGSIMAAYTALNGVPSSANKWLLTDVLRGQWGFKGYVVSDCGAVSHVTDAFNYAATPDIAVADCLNAGLDMEGGWFAQYPDVMNNYLQKALDKGLVTPQVVDHALSLVLTGRFKLGLFDPPDRVPFSKIPPSVIGSPEHVALARKLADESMVLLKNAPQNGEPLLPINPAKVKKIVVVGPYADIAQFGDYAGSPTINPVTPYQGLLARAQKNGISVTKVAWLNKAEESVPPDAVIPANSTDVSGLTGQYFTSGDLTGTPRATRTDQKLDFNWAHIQPDALATGKIFSVRWTGQIKILVAGRYSFSIDADGAYRLFIDEKPVINKWGDPSGGRSGDTEKVDLTAGNHPVRIEYRHNGGETEFLWKWRIPVTDEDYAALTDADLVVAVMGINTDFEIEGMNRSTLGIPEEQNDFLQKVLKKNPKTAVILESGSPLAVPWMAENVAAIVQAWYPGEEGGDALADVIFGDYNPSGRLPLTFYASDAQLRPMAEYDLTKGRTYMYLADKPLYAFGHGLSYTSFRYDNLRLSRYLANTHDQIQATVDITNTGNCDGDEVVQCYVHAETASVPMPIRQLWGFQRVSIPRNAKKTVSLLLQTKDFGHWDQAQHKFVVEPGKFDIEVGAASDDIRKTTALNVRAF